MPSRESTPDQYNIQPADWFQEGRYFEIWACTAERSDVELHKKKFILLDSKNIEGKGVRVDTYEGQKLKQLAFMSSPTRTIVALKRAGDGESSNLGMPNDDQSHQSLLAALAKLDEKLHKVYLEEDAPHDVPPNTHAALEHTYNIPFCKYKCQDLGLLESDSLKELQARYLAYLMGKWHTDPQRVMEMLGDKKVPVNSRPG